MFLNRNSDRKHTEQQICTGAARNPKTKPWTNTHEETWTRAAVKTGIWTGAPDSKLLSFRFLLQAVRFVRSKMLFVNFLFLDRFFRSNIYIFEFRVALVQNFPVVSVFRVFSFKAFCSRISWAFVQRFLFQVSCCSRWKRSVPGFVLLSSRFRASLGQNFPFVFVQRM